MEQRCKVKIFLWVLRNNLVTDQDIVDGDVNEFYKEPNESHHAKSHSDCSSDGQELFAIGFRAFLYQMHAILCELLQWLDEHFVESLFLAHVSWSIYKEREREREREKVPSMSVCD
jgi:hypothetical protein